MKRTLVIVVFCFLFLLCGCDYQEINRGLLVTAIGISQNDNRTNLTVEAISSSDMQDASSERQILTASGESVNEAFKNLDLQLVKPLYFEQLGTVVLEEDILDESVYFLKNMTNINYGIYVVKTNDVKSLFEFESLDEILGYDIIGLIKNYDKNKGVEISNQLYQINQNSVSIPTVTVVDDKLNLFVFGE